MRNFTLLLVLLLVGTIGFAQNKPMQIADIDTVDYTTDHPYIGNDDNIGFRKSFKRKDASYIKVHFTNFDLVAGDYVTVEDLRNNKEIIYEGKGKYVGGVQGQISDFWSQMLLTDHIVVTLHTTNSGLNYGFDIDMVAYGFSMKRINAMDRETRGACGLNDREEAICYDGTEIYNHARSVCKIVFNGGGACTGWLLGSEGHVMTNHHCIGDQGTANNVDFLFDYRTEYCNGGPILKGDVVASSSEFICFKPKGTHLDFALVKLPVNPTDKYGYLQLRDDKVEVGEHIYIAQHPLGQPLKVAVKDDQTNDGLAQVIPGTAWLSFSADSEQGSSGSPIISADEHDAVGLLWGGSCPKNQGSYSGDILMFMNMDRCIPKDAISTPTSTNSIIKSEFNVFPNPAVSTVTIELMDVQDVKVFDVLGNLVLEGQTRSLFVEHLNPGRYIVEVTTSNGQVSHATFVRK